MTKKIRPKEGEEKGTISSQQQRGRRIVGFPKNAVLADEKGPFASGRTIAVSLQKESIMPREGVPGCCEEKGEKTTLCRKKDATHGREESGVGRKNKMVALLGGGGKKETLASSVTIPLSRGKEEVKEGTDSAASPSKKETNDGP